MKSHILKFRVSEALFLLVGIGMLVLLPFLESQLAVNIWWGLKMLYFIGVAFFIFKK